MPVDPNTGNRLPYEGEPGYEEAKKKFPELYAAEEGGDEEEMPGDEGPADAEEQPEVPEDVDAERDLKPLMDEADAIMDAEDAEGAEAEESPEEEPEEVVADPEPEEDTAAQEEADAAREEEAPEAGDVGPLMETLGMSQERAEEMLMAAKAIPQYAEMGSEELAELLSSDFQVLMELERAAADLSKPEMPEDAMMQPQAPMA